MADAHVTPMPHVVEEWFRRETNVVFYYEGHQVPLNIHQRGNPGDIFAFRGIGGPEIERHLYVKTFPTHRQASNWEEVQHNIQHPKKCSLILRLCPGVPFWPTWYPVGRAQAKNRAPLNLGRAFDIFFRSDANRQDPLVIESDDENEVASDGE